MPDTESQKLPQMMTGMQKESTFKNSLNICKDKCNANAKQEQGTL